MLLTEADSRAITARLLGYVKADDAVVFLQSEDYSHLRFAANTFLTSGKRERTTARVTVWIDKRRGSSSTTDLSDAALKQAVEDAQTFARLAPVDVEYLPSLPQQTYRAGQGWVDATARVDLPARARQISEAIAQSEKAKIIGAGFHDVGLLAQATATAHGNFHYERGTIVGLSMTARTPDGSGSGYFARNHLDVARLDTGRIAREAIRRAVDSRGARMLPAGAYPVILEAQAVADLLDSGGMSFDARNADEGRSVFSLSAGATRVGTTLFDPRINIVSDPFRPELSKFTASDEGVPAQTTYLVRNGVLETLRYTRFWGQQKNRQPSGPLGLILEPSIPGVSVEEMIKTAKRALLVSRFFYIRTVDPRSASVTGLTRDGVWYVEDGEIKYPVRNFRFNQSIVLMLGPGNIDAIGIPERVASSEGGTDPLLVPALRLNAFNFTSQSDAI
jgi:predicted Zn-dependent protease